MHGRLFDNKKGSSRLCAFSRLINTFQDTPYRHPELPNAYMEYPGMYLSDVRILPAEALRMLSCRSRDMDQFVWRIWMEGDVMRTWRTTGGGVHCRG